MCYYKRCLQKCPSHISAAFGHEIHRSKTDASALHRQHHTRDISTAAELSHWDTLSGQSGTRWVNLTCPSLNKILDLLWIRWQKNKAHSSRLTRVVLLVSLDSIVADVRLLEKGMEMVHKEFQQHKDSVVLTDFLSKNRSLLDSVLKDSKTAQVQHFFLNTLHFKWKWIRCHML